jgi:hypothetical protein
MRHRILTSKPFAPGKLRKWSLGFVLVLFYSPGLGTKAANDPSDCPIRAA